MTSGRLSIFLAGCRSILGSDAIAPKPGSAEQAMATQSFVRQPCVLKVLLIEDDPIDAAWVTELIHEKCAASEVVHSTSLRHAFSVLAQEQIDSVFFSVRPEGNAESIRNCHEVVRRAGRRPVVALLTAAEMPHAAEVHAAGVKFVYRKHPILRTAQIRKQELRERLSSGETGPTI